VKKVKEIEKGEAEEVASARLREEEKAIQEVQMLYRGGHRGATEFTEKRRKSSRGEEKRRKDPPFAQGAKGRAPSWLRVGPQAHGELLGNSRGPRKCGAGARGTGLKTRHYTNETEEDVKVHCYSEDATLRDRGARI